MIARRSLIGGLLAGLAAPAIVRTPGLLMSVRVPKLPPAAFPDGYMFRLHPGVNTISMSDIMMNLALYGHAAVFVSHA